MSAVVSGIRSTISAVNHPDPFYGGLMVVLPPAEIFILYVYGATSGSQE